MSVRELHPAVFLDRDGTLTAEADWVRQADDVVLLESAAPAIRALNRAGYRLVLATNQSAVARGLITEAKLAEVHAHLAAQLERQGAHLDGIYTCPHHPSEGEAPYRRACECRKPSPGLLLQAARDLDLDLPRSWMIGDAERDIEAGRAAGVRGILVGTGKGTREIVHMRAMGAPPDHFSPDVLAAARWILEQDQGR